MTGASKLRETAERVRRDMSDGSAYHEAARMSGDKLRTDLQNEVFLTGTWAWRREGIAGQSTELIAKLLVDESHELRQLWGRMSIEDIEEMTAFNLLLDEVLISYESPPMTGTRRFGITTVEGTIAGWAIIIGARTANKPDTTALILKIPSRLRGWRLTPPSIAKEEAERRASEMRELVTGPWIDPYLVDRVTRRIVEHATLPMRDQLRQILRELSRDHMRILTTLQRASDYLIGRAIPSRRGRRFFSMIVSHAAYRGLLIGYDTVGSAGTEITQP